MVQNEHMRTELKVNPVTNVMPSRKIPVAKHRKTNKQSHKENKAPKKDKNSKPSHEQKTM